MFFFGGGGAPKSGGPFPRSVSAAAEADPAGGHRRLVRRGGRPEPPGAGGVGQLGRGGPRGHRLRCHPGLYVLRCRQDQKDFFFLGGGVKQIYILFFVSVLSVPHGNDNETVDRLVLFVGSLPQRRC